MNQIAPEIAPAGGRMLSYVRKEMQVKFVRMLPSCRAGDCFDKAIAPAPWVNCDGVSAFLDRREKNIYFVQQQWSRMNDHSAYLGIIDYVISRELARFETQQSGPHP